MRTILGRFAESLQNLLMCGRSFVFDHRGVSQASCTRPFPQCLVHRQLESGPAVSVCELTRPRFQQVFGRNGVLVQLVPAVHEFAIVDVRDTRPHGTEFLRHDAGGQRSPPITIPQQNNEIRLDPRPLAALDLAQTDLHSALIVSCFLANAPAEIDSLKTRAKALAHFVSSANGPPGDPRAFRSSLRSSKVELTKTRKVRVAVGIGFTWGNSGS